jgi:large subunit ribosomal protein L35
MPKIKTSSGAAKRFKVTANGHVTYSKGNRRHILTKKSRKRKRQLRRDGTFGRTEELRIKLLIPYA